MWGWTLLLAYFFLFSLFFSFQPFFVKQRGRVFSLPVRFAHFQKLQHTVFKHQSGCREALEKMMQQIAVP
jgi:hypothetical protein